MQNRQTITNTISTISQILIVSITLFMLYRFLLFTIGIVQMGLWSLVLATTSISQIANLGISGSMVKFVAKYIARGEIENANIAMHMAITSVGLITGFILIVGFKIFKWLLTLIIPASSLSMALAVLPFAIVALWLSMITATLNSGLDGFQRIDIRNYIIVSDSVLQLLLCYIFVPRYGLMGIAYARVLGGAVILAISRVILKRFLPLPGILSTKWDWRLFKEILGYSINFQAISAITIFCEPITKGLLSKFGGLASVGYYEMANKLIQQFRGLIVSTNQIIVPVVAHLQEKASERIIDIYLISYKLLCYIALPLYGAIIVCVPFISRLWIGHYEVSFILFAILLSIGQFLNTLAGPAYFSNLGIGNLFWNLIGHGTMATLNILLGFLLGMAFGGIGVVISWIISLALGSSVIYISFHIKNNIPLMELLPKESMKLALSCIVGVIFSLVAQIILKSSCGGVISNIIGMAVFLIIVFIPFWRHPMKTKVVRWLKHYISGDLSLTINGL